jgi:lipoyl(octanoyl) transferase
VTARPLCQVRWLGRIDYLAAWELQRDLVRARRRGQCPDTLLLLEHPHTFTLGRAGRPEHVLWDEAERARRGVALYLVDRGGDATYHGPGQLVGYPIVDLRPRGLDLHQYLRDLEEVIIRTVAAYGIQAGRLPGAAGVWVGSAKICAIGVRVSQAVTSHGFALNVTTDLTYFQGIVPCGLPDKGVTSIAALTGQRPALITVAAVLLGHFATVFGYRLALDPALSPVAGPLADVLS